MLNSVLMLIVPYGRAGSCLGPQSTCPNFSERATEQAEIATWNPALNVHSVYDWYSRSSTYRLIELGVASQPTAELIPRGDWNPITTRNDPTHHPYTTMAPSKQSVFSFSLMKVANMTSCLGKLRDAVGEPSCKEFIYGEGHWKC